MQEDYLWDKTGTDPEIERLENSLLAFRYQPITPPALPAKIVPFERKTPRNFFRLSLAFASCAALIVICLGVWFQFSGEKFEVVKDSVKTIVAPVEEKVSVELPAEKSDSSANKKVAIPKRTVESKIVKVRKFVSPNIRPSQTIARRETSEKPAVRLTKDEKYAYDQLMLALSITGSKLKLVKDKVDGVAEKTAVLENAR